MCRTYIKNVFNLTMSLLSMSLSIACIDVYVKEGSTFPDCDWSKLDVISTFLRRDWSNVKEGRIMPR